MLDKANCTGCLNWKQEMVQKIPEIHFKIGASNSGKSLIFNMTDMLKEYEGSCIFNMPLLYKEGASKDLAEGVTLGYEYWYRYQSIEYDFDAKKIAFNGGEIFKPIPPTPKD
jgi:hypothetical protein